MSKITEFKHIAFRIKAKILYESNFGLWYRNSLWKAATEADGVKCLHADQYYVNKDFTMNHIEDPKAIKRFTFENYHYDPQSDFVYKVEGNIRIEPKFSLAFLPERKFIVPTRSKAHKHIIPSFLNAIGIPMAYKKAKKFEQLIHFDGYASKNLYHFFDDAVNPLLLLFHFYPDLRSLPVLVHEDIFKLSWMQYLIKSPLLNDINWVVQKKDEWIETKVLYKGFSSKKWWAHTYNLLSDFTPKNPFRKVFLNRKAFYQRRLLNNDVIENIIREFDFEIVYAEDLSYADQVKLFSETKYLVGGHGAGLTNLIYADLQQCHVLEILSEDLLHPHYYWFYELVKIKYYDAIVGDGFDINWNFSIDADQFRKQLVKMMDKQ
jgi:hypothetical protein